MRRLTLTAALAVLATGGLTACSEEQAYCADLAGYVATAATFDRTDPADWAELAKQAKKVQDGAPKDVAGDWKKVVALAERGKAAADDPAEIAQVAKDVTQLKATFATIASHAKDSCKVDLPSLG